MSTTQTPPLGHRRRNKVTFEKLGRIDWEDQAAIYYGGEIVGTLERHTFQPDYPMDLRSAPYRYSVAIHDPADLKKEEVTKAFDVAGLSFPRGTFGQRVRTLSTGDHPNARAALNAAKRWARDLIPNHCNHCTPTPS